ncbi:MAG: DUF983 domain-containing protein [Chitinophagaceae bacterium]|nr:MAG: DUF983 domain-containing protein [Chitinophagaceae bacterium]
MKPVSSTPTPNYFWSILTMRCPRCRRGPMYKDSNPYKKLTLKHISNMHDTCPVCSQKYDMETGFWYGTGYVSYALAVAMSVATFVAWWVLIGISINDNRVMYWFIFNSIVLVVAQPWMMRMSRVIYMRFFVSYDPEYQTHKPVEFK